MDWNCHDIIEVMWNASNLLVCFYRRNGLQIFNYTTDIKKLKLMVNVFNIESQDRKAEDAYSAVLNVTIPSSLSYSSLNPKVRSLDVLRNYTSGLSCNKLCQRSPISRLQSRSRPSIDWSRTVYDTFMWWTGIWYPFQPGQASVPVVKPPHLKKRLHLKSVNQSLSLIISIPPSQHPLLSI